MSIVTADISITLDGFGAAADQSREHPFGSLDENRLHSWMFEHADDNAAEVAAIVDAGAFVMGRNMFSPDRGAWDLDWRGWWGEDPPYRAPVFVLTHHERDPLPMAGGTTFHFVTDGLDAAVERAREAAGARSVAIAGGASTISACLAAGHLDELRLHLVPYVAGLAGGSADGPRMFDGVGPLGLEPVATRHTPYVTHLTYRRGWRHGREALEGWVAVAAKGPAVSTPNIRPVSGPAEFPALAAIWRSAVDATHDFLAAADRDEIEAQLQSDYFPAVVLSVAECDGRPAGFSGVLDGSLEMLFVGAAQRGGGVGTALLHHAIADHGVTRVDVNEQNLAATGFYVHRGFEVVGRSETDEAGRPYPLLHLRLGGSALADY